MPCRALLLCFATFFLQAALPSYQKVGSGPGVLLVHGFGGNKEVWAGVLGELARDHTVVAVDLPGSGGTPGPQVLEGRADMGTVARELAALVRKEGLAPCLVVGHSMGGPLAAGAVLADPSAFRGLLLVDSFLGAIPEAYMEPVAVALAKDPAPTLSTFFGRMTSGAAQTDRLVADGLKVPVATLQAYLRAMTKEALGGRQAQLHLPVLQLAAGPREVDPAKESATLAMYGFKGIPAFRLLHFPTAKHWIMWDAPESFLMALRAFEAGLGR
ncbi:alpha/beta fold hydrolase [Geothrix sp. PMB-07]|uniref:alpha/beta fold hydrolase n=1 Tax=Geothrix sp. PMB-07 TaxID=3068640 RepID=UPI002741E477|nr:alpha/beta fold hydrolase [Geothrix sp. PMB-07]WLT32594.1 alpha/beta fold hydrolase [Geothrix sp. PMB-07]